MRTLITKLSIFSLFLALMSCGGTNCPGDGCITKNGAPTEAQITVLDVNGNPMNGVTVEIYHTEAASIFNDPLFINENGLSQQTSSGIVNFDFSEIYDRGQSNVATVFVKVLDATGTELMMANANAKQLELLMEKTVEHTIQLR